MVGKLKKKQYYIEIPALGRILEQTLIFENKSIPPQKKFLLDLNVTEEMRGLRKLISHHLQSILIKWVETVCQRHTIYTY